MANQHENSNSVDTDSVGKAHLTIGEYIDRYTGIHQQILSLESQIKILNKIRQRYEISAFDQSIQQLNDALNVRKAESVPVVLTLSQGISWLVGEKDRDYLFKFVFLDQSTREIAICHGISEQLVACAINRAIKIQIPDSVVSKYGEDVKG